MPSFESLHLILITCTYLYPNQIFGDRREDHISQRLTGMIKPNSISMYANSLELDVIQKLQNVIATDRLLDRLSDIQFVKE